MTLACPRYSNISIFVLHVSLTQDLTFPCETQLTTLLFSIESTPHAVLGGPYNKSFSCIL